MNTTKFVNGAAVLTPLVFFVTGNIFLSLFCVFFTGIIQLVIALNFLGQDIEVKRIKRYLLIVVIYFLIWIALYNVVYCDFDLGYYVFIAPAIPAFYLTYIIHTIKNK